MTTTNSTTTRDNRDNTVDKKSSRPKENVTVIGTIGQPIGSEKRGITGTIGAPEKRGITGTIGQPNGSEKRGILRSLSFQFTQFRNNSKRNSTVIDLPPLSTIPEQRTNSADYGPIVGAQCYGTLCKKYKRKNRPAKWNKRSYKNTMVYESLLKEMENRGVLLNEERKAFEERLQAEEIARQEQIDRNMNLEKMKEELEKEREKLIRMTKKLRDDLLNVKNELKMTSETKRTLEQEKLSLTMKTDHLASNMESLNLEKSKIEDQMTAIIREREKFLLENQNLSTITCQLKNRLMEIESKTNMMCTEKQRVEAMLRLNEQKTLDLEKERQYYNTQTRELLTSLKDVNKQKEITEIELREEVMARLSAERQLHAAEKALEHLEAALKLTGAQMSELQEHIMPDVHKLREFFERCAEEAKLDANKPLIMKNAIVARRSIRRSKTRFSFRRHFRNSFRGDEKKGDKGEGDMALDDTASQLDEVDNHHDHDGHLQQMNNTKIETTTLIHL